MTNTNSFCAKFSPGLLSIMRMAVGFLFMSHGCQKVFGYPPGGFKVDYGHLMNLMSLAAFLEFVGGAFILFGFLTRPTAFILSGEMAVAYFKAHAHRALWPLENGGEVAVVYCFVFFYLIAAGAGPLSVDALRKKE